jgi:YD repeat-containing protein
MTERRMKSDQVRTNWRDVLEYVRAGGVVIVEHYNRAVARIAPLETTMTAAMTFTSPNATGRVLLTDDPDAAWFTWDLSGHTSEQRYTDSRPAAEDLLRTMADSDTPVACGILDEDPDWRGPLPSPVALPPAEAFKACTSDAMTEREGMPACEAHAAEWDRKYGDAS